MRRSPTLALAAWRRRIFAGDSTLLLLVRAVTLQTRTVSNNAPSAAQRQERVGPGKDRRWHAARVARGGSELCAVAADMGLPGLCGTGTPFPDWHLDLPLGVDSMVREEVYRLQARVDMLEQVRLGWEWVLLVSTDPSLWGCGSKSWDGWEFYGERSQGCWLSYYAR